MKFEITSELLEQQAIKHNIHLYNVRTCSICESPIGYYFDWTDVNSNGTIKLKVIWDGSCNCTMFDSTELRSWQDIVDLYNFNIDNASFVENFRKDWHLDELISLYLDSNIDALIEETKSRIDDMSLFISTSDFNNLSDNVKILINNAQNTAIKYLSILEQYKKQH